MKYACNISYELMSILEENPQFCDYIKIGAFGDTEHLLDEVFKKKPLLIHGFGWHERGGMLSTEVIDYDKINNYIQKYSVPFIGIHSLCFPEDVPKDNKGTGLNQDGVLEHMVSVFREFQQKILTDVIIENMDFNPKYTWPSTIKETVEPDFLTTLIKKTELDLLLDIGHAKVSAAQLGMDVLLYLDALPLERVREIHFSGTTLDKKMGVIDAHQAMEAEDYIIAEYLKQQIENRRTSKLEIVTLEYGTVRGDATQAEAIIEQIKKLNTIFK